MDRCICNATPPAHAAGCEAMATARNIAEAVLNMRAPPYTVERIAEQVAAALIAVRDAERAKSKALIERYRDAVIARIPFGPHVAPLADQVAVTVCHNLIDSGES